MAEFDYMFTDGTYWKIYYDVSVIPEFCGAKQAHYFRTNINMTRAAEKLEDKFWVKDNPRQAEELREKFREFGKAFIVEVHIRSYFRRGMRMVWWEAAHRPMYHIGEALRARAGRKFVNPNSGNVVSQFMIKI